MRLITKTVLCSLTFLMITVLASAETFYLKDGNKVTGDIVSHEDGLYTINTSFGVVDIPDDNIDKISDKAAEMEEEIKEIKIASQEIKRHFVPEYEDQKYHDPLYIAYSQAKYSAISLTACGSTFLGIGLFTAAIALPVYFYVKNLGNTVLPECEGSDVGGTLESIGLALVLPWIVAPASLGFILLMACIGPWIYANKLLYAWQSKYHVNMSMVDKDKLELGFSISL